MRPNLRIFQIFPILFALPPLHALFCCPHGFYPVAFTSSLAQTHFHFSYYSSPVLIFSPHGFYLSTVHIVTCSNSFLLFILSISVLIFSPHGFYLSTVHIAICSNSFLLFILSMSVLIFYRSHGRRGRLGGGGIAKISSTFKYCVIYGV